MNTVILLVEDDAVIRNNLSSLLQQEEFQTIACSSLEEARGTLLHRVPDLAVLDVLLPDGSGFDLCREIRASYKIPILFLTCCDEDEDTIKGLECGGDDYVAKPFRAKVLISRIKALLRRTQMEQSSDLQIGAFHFENDKRICRLDGAAIPLTPIEYRILYELAKNKNKIVSREHLLHAIWEMGCAYMDESTLTVHISRIRGKLGNQSDKLLTVRGEGYLLRCENE